MPHPGIVDGPSLLTNLADAGVEFITVGGTAAELHGSPMFTANLDIVHSRTPENVARLVSVLESLDAIFRADFSGRKLRPTTGHLSGPGQSLLATQLGPLDCRGTLHDGRGFDELLTHTVVVPLRGRSLRVLDLRTLIAIKASTGREKDRAAVAHLTPLLRDA